MTFTKSCPLSILLQYLNYLEFDRDVAKYENIAHNKRIGKQNIN